MNVQLALTVAIMVLPTLAAVSSGQPTVEELLKMIRATDRQQRETLFELLQPVVLSNCELERFGEPNDGGYLMCANLLGQVEAGYSYGIANYDQWGCDISKRLGVTLHQYDCFDTRQPACPGGNTVFHAECVADTRKTDEGRLFDSMQNQFAKNGDDTKRLVVKMDVETAEWDSLLHASDETLQRIDQLAIELHGMHEPRHIEVVKRLKQFFHIVHIHFNNHTCVAGIEPFPAWAYEVLFVNKRIATVDTTKRWPGVHKLATPADPKRPDCQTVGAP
jgi:hypothetical protein